MTAIALPAAPRRPPAAPPAWVGGSMPVSRLGVVVNLLVPVALLAWDALHHHLGVDAVNFAIKTTGLVAVTYLVLSLVVTPLKMVTGLAWLVQFRRAVGVYAFVYAAIHLSIYFWWDQARNLRSTAFEITHRWYLIVGFTSLSLMAPLAATSFNAAIQRMGGRNWKRLHRLAYAAAALGCYHYYLQSKSDKSRPDVYLLVLAGLLLWRAVAWGVRLAKRPARAGAANGFPVVMPDAGAKARSWKGDLKVVGLFRETDAVRTFRLAPPGGGPVPFAFKAGQFLNLTVPVGGKATHRSYTIASPPTRDAYVELTVKREADGTVSKYLHDMLMTGQTVAVSAPAGRFTFDPKPDDAGVTLVAGGVGVTPVMSILRDLTDRSWPGRIDLVFSVRSPADVIFADELKYLAGRHPNLHAHVTVTRDAPADWPGPRGRLTPELLKQWVPDVAARPAFVCGPDAMAAAARESLVAAGVPADRVTIESFTPAAAAPAGDAGAAVGTVTFAKSDRTADLTANRTVLEAAESAGVNIDFQCRAGICGTCRCKLLSGGVTMAVRDALSDADEADGYILACQAKSDGGDLTVDA